MRLSARLCLLFLLGIFTTRVASQSELAHAYERIYFWANYRMELAIYGYNPDNFVAPTCFIPFKDSGGETKKRGCNFNEFMHYLATGNKNVPRNLDLLENIEGPYNRRQDFFLNQATNDRVAQVIANKPIYSEGEFPHQRLVSGSRGFVSLYDSMGELFEYCKHDAPGMGKQAALKTYGDATKGLASGVIKLRKGATQSKLAEELKKTFPGDSNHYPVYDKPGGGKYEPIQWASKTESYAGRNWEEIDWVKTKGANPQMAGTELEKRVDQRINDFNQDAKKLVTWNPKYPNSNKNHNAVVERIRNMGRRCYV